MCKEILPNLFRLKIPLPESPLKYLNSYVIRDADENLIIDTGLNRQECLEAMTAGLRKVGIDLAKIRYFYHPSACRSFWTGSETGDGNKSIFISAGRKKN